MELEPSLEKALADLRIYDLAIDLHGSRALGIAQSNSNVDVLITRPLEGLLNELQDDPSRFRHECSIESGPPWYLPPILKLLHVPTGTELDLISRWSADIFVRERDAVAKACFAQEERVQPYLEMVMKWAKRRGSFMSVDHGYPSAYCFRLFALHFLMTRMTLGVVLPPLTAFGAFVDLKHDVYKNAKIDKSTPADDLAVEFLEHLGKSGKSTQPGIWADLRKPFEVVPSGVWQVVDPPSHKPLLKLNQTQITEISKMAKMDAKALRNNKGALDNL